jgi:hypothetical protein
VDIPIGPLNRFAPDPIDRGQLTVFLPGRSQAQPFTAFRVVFNGTPLVWTLSGRTATASADSTVCATELTPNDLRP